MSTTCSRCGVVEGGHADHAPLGWSSTTTSDGVEHLCPGCTRAHVRDIEGKLDETWWG